MVVKGWGEGEEEESSGVWSIMMAVVWSKGAKSAELLMDGG